MKTLAFYLLVLTPSTYFGSTGANYVSQTYRLDKWMVPHTYQISFKFDVNFNETRRFQIETCRIRFNINPDFFSGDLTKIRINYCDAVDQNYTVTLMDKNGNLVDLKMEKPNNVTQTIQLHLTDSNLDIEKQPYTIEFTNLTGVIRDDNFGIYLGKYTHGNQNKLMLSTTFRSVRARLAFPCFDEPSMMAHFQISLTVPRYFKTVLGNTRKISEDNIIGYDLKIVKFEQTPKISTYQVAFLISTFDEVVVNPSNPKFKFYCPEENTRYLGYAVNVTPIIVREIEAVLGVNFTRLGIDKLDQAALPVTYTTIQHFGLILLKDTTMYYSINQTTIQEYKLIFLFMASNIAQLYTNKYLVMEWWSHRWLPEGLASYLCVKLADKIIPELEVGKMLAVLTMTRTMEMDGSPNSLLLTSKEEDIYNYSSIAQKMSELYFYKSPAILLMMEGIVGEEAFYKSLQKLPNKNPIGKLNPLKFFEVFESDGLPIGRLKGWTDQAGYPVVTVKRFNNSAVLSQKQFLFHNYRCKTKWHIPIAFSSRSHNADFMNTLPTHWLSPNADLVIEDAFKESDWIIVNINQHGYYRVNYDESLWPNILQVLNSDNFGGIPAIIRARLIDDVLNMARVMRQSYHLAMDVTQYLKKESDYYPWVVAYNAFSYLLKRIGKRTELREMLKKYVASLSSSLSRSLKQDQKNNIKNSPINILKADLTEKWFCDYDYPDHVTEAKKNFQIYKTNPKILVVDVNYQYSMLCCGIKYGNASDWNFLFEQYKKSTFPSEKTRMLQALGCSKEAAVLGRFLEMTLDPTSDIQKHNYYHIFIAVLKSKVDIAQTFLQENIEDISKNYASWNALSTIINDLTDRFTTVAQIEEFKIFVENSQVALKEAFGDLAQSSIKSAEANVKWLATFEDELSEWLTEELHKSKDTSATTKHVGLPNFIIFFCILLLIIYY